MSYKKIRTAGFMLAALAVADFAHADDTMPIVTSETQTDMPILEPDSPSAIPIKPPTDARDHEPGALGVELSDTANGVTVIGVRDQSPAAESGVLAGDVIISINGQPYPTVGRLQRAITRMKPGEDVAIEILRPEGRVRIKATLASRDTVFKEELARRTARYAPDDPFAPIQLLQDRVSELERQVASLRSELQRMRRLPLQPVPDVEAGDRPTVPDKAPLSAGVIDDTEGEPVPD